MFVGTVLLAGVLVPLILGDGFTQSVPILRVLALMFPFVVIDQVITGYVLIPLRLDKVVIRVSLQNSLVTFVLMVSLAAAFGGLGVSWARTVGAMLMAGSRLAANQSRQILRRIFTP